MKSNAEKRTPRTLSARMEALRMDYGGFVVRVRRPSGSRQWTAVIMSPDGRRSWRGGGHSFSAALDDVLAARAGKD